MTQIFINRPELMMEGETTKDHRKRQQEEAELVEKDKNTTGDHGGLFCGHFPPSSHRNFHLIRDDEDGVDRCPRCAWELEGGFCPSCQFNVAHSVNSGSASPTISYDTEDEIAQRYFMDQHGDFIDHYIDPELDQGGDIYPSSGLSDDSGEDIMAIASERAAIRRRNGARGRPVAGRLQNPSARRPYSEADNEGDTDDYSAEDDEAGSLDDFVVHDVEEEPFVGLSFSPRSSRYASDEVSDIIPPLISYSSDGGEEDHSHGEESEMIQNHEQPENQPINLDSDSDEGPIRRTGRHVYQTSTVSLSPSPSDGSEDIALAAHNRSRQFRRQQNDLAMGRILSRTGPTAINHARSPGPRSGSRGVAVEINSDSDSPSLVQRPRRRRALQHLIISDDDEDEHDDATAANAGGDVFSVFSRPSSSGTATVGRPSPRESSTRRDDMQPAVQEFPAVSPILINSSPVGSDAGQNGWSPYQESTISLDDVPRAPRASIARSGHSRSRTRDSYTNRNEQRHRVQSPRPRRPTIQPSSAPTSQPALSRGLIEGPRSDRARHVVNSRAARKAERQLVKQDRRRREQDRANISGSSGPTASPDGSEVMNLDGGVQYVNRNRSS